MSTPIQVISLGAGVQSSFLDKASRKGAFGLRPHCSIFADTEDEPLDVYRWLEELKQAQGHPIHTVKPAEPEEFYINLYADGTIGKAWRCKDSAEQAQDLCRPHQRTIKVREVLE